MTTTTIYAASGLTCGHCVNAVTAELVKLAGVREVTVELVAGGTSPLRVASDMPLEVSDVRAAIDEAGYVLVDPAP
jgi:copper chaperone CopZ